MECSFGCIEWDLAPSDDFADRSKGYESDLVEDVVFVLVGRVEFYGELAGRCTKVHRFKFSYRLETFLVLDIVLELEVPDSLHCVTRHCICR